METTNQQSQINHQLACEAFLRRASMFEHPFVLKGSFATKQHFETGIDRIPNDIDWVYTVPIDEPDETKTIFLNWLNTIINTSSNDDIFFKELEGDYFLWSVDYADEIDFPTAGIDIECSVNGKKLLGGIRVEISFEIKLNAQPEPLKYHPLQGEVFIVPQVVPLFIQIAWKLHQVILRPRFKDIFDLIYFLPIINTDEVSKNQLLQELISECEVNGGNITNLSWYVTENAERYAYLFENNQIHTQEFKKLKQELAGIEAVLTIYVTEYKDVSSNTELAPDSLSSFLKKFRLALNNAGFTTDTFQNLPQSNVVKRPIIETTETQTTQYQENIIAEETTTFWDRLRNIFR